MKQNNHFSIAYVKKERESFYFMKKELIKPIVLFSLLGTILAGCQEKVDTPIENASTDSGSTESTDYDHNHSHDHSHDDEKQKEIYSGIFEDGEVER